MVENEGGAHLTSFSHRLRESSEIQELIINTTKTSVVREDLFWFEAHFAQSFTRFIDHFARTTD